MFKEWMLNSTQTIDRALIRSVHNIISKKKNDLLVWNLKYVWLNFACFEIIIKPPPFWHWKQEYIFYLSICFLTQKYLKEIIQEILYAEEALSLSFSYTQSHSLSIIHTQSFSLSLFLSIYLSIWIYIYLSIYLSN